MFRYFLIFCFAIASLFSAPNREPLELELISDAKADRIVFQSIHLLDAEGKLVPPANPAKDASVATLLVIKNGEVYVWKDGFDSKQVIDSKRDSYFKAREAYRERANYIKEFQDLESEKLKSEKLITLPSKQKEVDDKFHRLFLRYDETYKKLDALVKQNEGKIYNALKFKGESSQEYANSLKQKEESEKQKKDRFSFLVQALKKISIATDASSSDLPPAPDPGPYFSQNFYANNIDSKVDQFQYARSGKKPDFTKMDSQESKEVETTYGKVYTTLRERLIKEYIEKLNYYSTFLALTNSEVKFEEPKTAKTSANPVSSNSESSGSNQNSSAETPKPASQNANPGSNFKQAEKKGSRIILATGDGHRFVLEDLDGDGITESFFVSNSTNNFEWDRDTANIICILNNTDEAIKALIGNLNLSILKGSNIKLSDVKNPKEKSEIYRGDTELLQDLEELLKEK